MISADEKNKLEEKLKECQELNEILSKFFEKKKSFYIFVF